MHEVLRKLPEEVRSGLKRKAQPDFLPPMRATLVHEHFSDPNWIYERKLDGERCLLTKKNGAVTLYSRNGKKKNHTYPEIAAAVRKLDGSFILDAELVTFDGKLTSFKRLQKRIHVKKPGRQLIEEYPVVAYVFDILFLDRHDTTGIPLRLRKQVLRDAFGQSETIRVLPHRNEDGEAYLREACDKGWEGLIAKDARAKYVHSRSKKWLKFKCGHRQEMVIAGYTDPEGERVGFGALLLGYHDGDDLVYGGRVGTGFDDEFLESFHRRLKRKERKTSPFADFDPDLPGIHWVTPEFVGEVGFTEWTRAGRMRHPRFIGLRDDKDPESVVREEES